ncbi:unnamed protein product [Periconia digitata]|uniref:Uncharacterized protein n=1 Tax=Periconia digitata TaxID=1303443 RepID=A0A9W4UKZ2_9PLEO|nr:unnamed protein product [Periconia digitata]
MGASIVAVAGAGAPSYVVDRPTCSLTLSSSRARSIPLRLSCPSPDSFYVRAFERLSRQYSLFSTHQSSPTTRAMQGPVHIYAGAHGLPFPSHGISHTTHARSFHGASISPSEYIR